MHPRSMLAKVHLHLQDSPPLKCKMSLARLRPHHLLWAKLHIRWQMPNVSALAAIASLVRIDPTHRAPMPKVFCPQVYHHTDSLEWTSGPVHPAPMTVPSQQPLPAWPSVAPLVPNRPTWGLMFPLYHHCHNSTSLSIASPLTVHWPTYIIRCCSCIHQLWRSPSPMSATIETAATRKTSPWMMKRCSGWKSDSLFHRVATDFIITYTLITTNYYILLSLTRFGEGLFSIFVRILWVATKSNEENHSLCSADRSWKHRGVDSSKVTKSTRLKRVGLSRSIALSRQ